MEAEKEKTRVVVVCGPTGIGKTSAAIELAEIFGGEIVSADSMQIYRQLDIGTAKPTAEEMARIPHSMVDVADPDEPFDAARFSKMAAEEIAKLEGRGLLPFVAGGTGLYIKALVHGLFRARPADDALLARLTAEAGETGSANMHLSLSAVDPVAAGKIHPNDTFRIVRALEHFQATGERISECQSSHGFSEDPYRVLKIGLTMDREALYDRINLRVDMMLDEGVLAEVEGLLARGYGRELKSMQSIGYRHMCDFLAGEVTWEETVRLLKRDTRRYAKRQMTWFRKDEGIVWVERSDTAAMKKLVEEWLHK